MLHLAKFPSERALSYCGTISNVQESLFPHWLAFRVYYLPFHCCQFSGWEMTPQYTLSLHLKKKIITDIKHLYTGFWSHLIFVWKWSECSWHFTIFPLGVLVYFSLIFKNSSYIKDTGLLSLRNVRNIFFQFVVYLLLLFAVVCCHAKGFVFWVFFKILWKISSQQPKCTTVLFLLKKRTK